MFIFLLFFLLFAGNNAYAQSNLKVKTKYNYVLFLPKGYSEGSNRYPLVIYLHGGSQKGNDLNKVKAYGWPHLIDRGQEFGFIVAAPQCPEGKYWSTENWFDSLYMDLISKYRIDSSRIYLTGISMGGYGTYITAMDHPNEFAAIIPLCGGCNDTDTIRICDISRVPVWAFHGTADEKIPITETERVVNKLDQCNENIRFTRLEGIGHDLQFIYERKDVFDWLLLKKKQDVHAR
ncbi:prolyl oligopeptidase family serine peptidase [Chitinophaga eiseniae]|uniref:Prolyl oligopeptidase family serine peptidase n=1 Tax=Chitinophaga eiseniae TaxID=634771 RepID=A0A847SW54_9BACT|nr:prolyl oligopeptidase family serine peptidase [Chitinophaga eiseniae]NLR82908.1 prolyl oligopeptidase family serine peptidase [Chitinophaga eiseniae]